MLRCGLISCADLFPRSRHTDITFEERATQQHNSLLTHHSLTHSLTIWCMFKSIYTLTTALITFTTTATITRAMSFGQFAATSQFYLYGTQYCTRTGWERASRQYPQPDELDTVDLSNRVFIVTGANSGIGFESSSFLAKKGATVYMVCRNPERAEIAKNKIVELTKASKNGIETENIFVILGDCSLQSGIQKIWNDFKAHRELLGVLQDNLRLDGILCNAGGLNNESIVTTTAEGIETTFAAHLLFGTYHLVNLALPTLENTPNSRVIVVSSGGMYNTKFPSWNRATARRGTFDGQFAYAYAKRGQVLLCEEWTKMYPKVTFASCHPGNKSPIVLSKLNPANFTFTQVG